MSLQEIPRSQIRIQKQNTKTVIIQSVRPKQFFFSVKIELLVDFEPKLKRDPIVNLNNISSVHIILSEKNNVVYSFAQIK